MKRLSAKKERALIRWAIKSEMTRDQQMKQWLALVPRAPYPGSGFKLIPQDKPASDVLG